MSVRAEYLKKYMSGDAADDGKKKKKKKTKEGGGFQPIGMRIIEGDAYLSVDAAKTRELGSDEEREELEVIQNMVTKAKVVHGFKKSFAEVEAPKIIKEELRSPSPEDQKVTQSSASKENQKRKRHDSSASENSPPRRQRHDSSPDASPPRRRRHDSDNSPPRAGRRRHDSDKSPPRRRRHDSDASPQRARRQRHDSDNSPPRKRGNQKDSSPPRRRRHDSDNSPRRRPTAAAKAENDLSPPRRRHNDISGGSSRRVVEAPKRVKEEEVSDGESDVKAKTKTLDGKIAGLQTAKALREEGDRLRAREAEMFDEMDMEVSGRDAATVYRKKQIQKGKDDPEVRAKKEREAKKTEELKEKYKDWNKGVAQIQQRAEQLEEMARVAAEPMAREKDDEAMNRHLKEKMHEADPMASMLMRQRRDAAIDRGELVYPTYQGPWVPNRFSIAPGYRWDGVDRSNGFEGQLARTRNEKAANQQEYYKAIATLD